MPQAHLPLVNGYGSQESHLPPSKQQALLREAADESAANTAKDPQHRHGQS